MLWPVILKLTACILNVNQGFKTDRGEEDTAMDKEQLERDGLESLPSIKVMQSLCIPSPNVGLSLLSPEAMFLK